MKRVEYPAAIRALIAELKRMPGIGPRSAERIALWMVQSRDARPRDIAASVVAVCEHVHACPQCGFFTTEPLCEFCAAPDRDNTLLCVVEQPTDILPLERTGVFRGEANDAEDPAKTVVAGVKEAVDVALAGRGP